MIPYGVIDFKKYLECVDGKDLNKAIRDIVRSGTLSGGLCHREAGKFPGGPEPVIANEPIILKQIL